MSTGATPAGLSATELKACCSAAYEQDWVALLLGPSYHPGGLELTGRLAGSLALSPGMRVLDVASGPGTTASYLAERFGVQVTGADRSASLVSHARDAAAREGLAGQVGFVLADGESLPFASGCFDAVVCECAFCTFPDKTAGAAELARVLSDGGRVGLTDVTVDAGRLGEELDTIGGWVGCIRGACSIEGYREHLEGAGLEVLEIEEHGAALGELLAKVQDRLLAVAALRLPGLPEVDADQVRYWMGMAEQALASRAIGYSLLIAKRIPGSEPRVA